MLANGSAQAIKKNDQIALWFPDAAVPSLRTLAPNSEFNLSLGEKDQIWHVFLHLPNQPKETIAEYSTEKQARRALWRMAEAIGGKGPRDHWWFARWGGVLILLSFIAIMEITLATGKPSNQSAAGPSSRPPGAIPMTSFGAPPTMPGAMTPTSGIAARSPITSAPIDRAPKPQATGLSAFGLDERTPPGGISAIPSDSEIDSKAKMINKIESGKKPEMVAPPPSRP